MANLDELAEEHLLALSALGPKALVVVLLAEEFFVATKDLVGSHPTN
jgi:hypothetical protein